ncbi:YjhG/YagF family D-xylonate dehydratase [Phototrophicus methaneseepsis]|uniref:YjhG/YagF family D-xylonate dehydratase n=1 Tax=Phototrophicus methaneseepsis TaxID=2710758 RepID=A0A7S8ED14_9CHLR|nr:YjhG/YagF family D-xylonate dehydratase [Phototrophicus methaneseepsis]QPC84715.1 YjhG/YagF family D-xylonate dehydratase [Phototrophicus methaneseepsis]
MVTDEHSKDIYGDGTLIQKTRTHGHGTDGRIPLTEDLLLNAPSGNLFAMTQNVAMGWNPEEVNREQYVIVSTQGGLRAEDGTAVALGYHTGHWEIGLLVREAAEAIRSQDAIPFAVYCSDPCDGRSQGTTGMMDSLPYRNDAAIVMRRLIRSLPTRDGVMGVATCDKGLPATMIALAGCTAMPGVIVPGGVTLPTPEAEDAGSVQTIGARFAHDIISLDYAAEMGCKACGSSGGGCQFLGTAATAQVVAEAFGLSLPHSALAPSGEPIWLDMARRSALALMNLKAKGITLGDILTQKSLENAMLLHAAFGGSTNLLLHIPAIAYAAGLKPPTVEDWSRINRMTPRLVDALPNGPRNHPTVQVFMAGGVPEVMLHLRDMGLLHLDVLTVGDDTLGDVLDWWENSERRQLARERLAAEDHVDPADVIMDADTARKKGLSSTMLFPTGNIAPQGAVIKATAIDPSVVGADNVYRHRGPARVFTSEHAAIQAIKGLTENPVRPNDVLVLAGVGPSGTGMEETYQVTSALKFIPWGKQVPILTDARFSGVSTGACIGHIGPEALVGGPIGRLRDGDLIEIVIDRNALHGTINFLGPDGEEQTPEAAQRILLNRPPHPGLQANPKLPDDTRLWAALQAASGGVWAGSVYDVDKIITTLQAGMKVLSEERTI